MYILSSQQELCVGCGGKTLAMVYYCKVSHTWETTRLRHDTTGLKLPTYSNIDSSPSSKTVNPGPSGAKSTSGSGAITKADSLDATPFTLSEGLPPMPAKLYTTEDNIMSNRIAVRQHGVAAEMRHP